VSAAFLRAIFYEKHGPSERAMAGLRNYRRRSPMPQWQSRLAEVECHRCKTRASIPLMRLATAQYPGLETGSHG
jgi:hypothetical protein